MVLAMLMLLMRPKVVIVIDKTTVKANRVEFAWHYWWRGDYEMEEITRNELTGLESDDGRSSFSGSSPLEDLFYTGKGSGSSGIWNNQPVRVEWSVHPGEMHYLNAGDDLVLFKYYEKNMSGPKSGDGGTPMTRVIRVR